MEPVIMKTCDMCKKETSTENEDITLFGEWMTRSDVTVHYYCLLLSTNLPQRGQDHNGILGFLLRDIRKEINLARKRSCIYCNDKSATIMCCVCNVYFHFVCGHTNRCLSEFIGEFKSYCRNCVPLDEGQKMLEKSAPDLIKNICYICKMRMGARYPYTWIISKCCNNGYVHSLCMKKYALNAGYYLMCIWCKSKQFREDVKYMGIFVPDRDADWEREKGAFKDLHRSNRRCDMDTCHCAKGRSYSKSKWAIITCKLCGLVGAHNPHCIPGMEHVKQPIVEFKCNTCSATEHTVVIVANESRNLHEIPDINSSLYVSKICNVSVAARDSIDTEFSDDTASSVETVINKYLKHNIVTESSMDIVINKNVVSPSSTPAVNFVMPTLTQGSEEEANKTVAELPDNDNIFENCPHCGYEHKTDDDSDPFIDNEVDRLLALFKP